MEIPEHRRWMVKRMGPDRRRVTDEFLAGVVEFIEFACAQENYKKGGKLRCPCAKCKCLKFHLVEDVKGHLCMKGFKSGYYCWTSHGERRTLLPPIVSSNSFYGSGGAQEHCKYYEEMMAGSGRNIGGERVASQTSHSPQPPISSFQTEHTLDPSPHSQTRPTPVISQPLQASTASAIPPHSHFQIRPTSVISKPLQNSPTSSSSPHSQTGSSIGLSLVSSLSSHENPCNGTPSLTPENIKWWSKDVDGRIWIMPAPGNNFHLELEVRGVITKIVKKKFEGAWTSWSNVDDDMIDKWFADFKAKYKWLEHDEDNIKKSFDSRGSLALKNALFRVHSGKDKGGWIDEKNLEQLRVKWQADDWQKVSTMNKKNRQSQDGHNVHSGGSISTREHAKRMKMEMNSEPTYFEIYDRLHRPKRKPN